MCTFGSIYCSGEPKLKREIAVSSHGFLTYQARGQGLIAPLPLLDRTVCKQPHTAKRQQFSCATSKTDSCRSTCRATARQLPSVSVKQGAAFRHVDCRKAFLTHHRTFLSIAASRFWRVSGEGPVTASRFEPHFEDELSAVQSTAGAEQAVRRLVKTNCALYVLPKVGPGRMRVTGKAAFALS